MNPFADLMRPILCRPGDAPAPSHAQAPRREIPPRLDLPEVVNPWGLTPVEAEVIRLIVEGLSSQEIGARLKRSQKTIEVHRTHILEKMEMHSTVVAAVAWVRFTMQAKGGDERTTGPTQTTAAAAIRTGKSVTLAPIVAVDFGTDGLEIPTFRKGPA